MTNIKNVATVVLALTAAGCTSSPSSSPRYKEYAFNGKIDDQEISTEYSHACFAIVVKTPNSEYRYADYGQDGIVDMVGVKKKGDIRHFQKSDSTQTDIMQQAQKEFDAYLARILETKKTEAQDFYKH